MKGFKEYIKEADRPDYHSVEYYAEVGQHGEVNNYPTMSQAYKEAVKFGKRKDNADLWYVGVSGNSDEFAVIRVNESYIKHMSSKMFKDKKGYDSWNKVAKQVLKTGKPMKGKY